MQVFLERVMSLVRREVVRTMRKYHKPPRNALVSSYDKQKYAIKVQFQPEGTESGWIPLTSTAVGNKFGIQEAPNIKDQVQIIDQEGEHKVGHVITRHFSTLDQPNPIEAGEYLKVHKTGSGVYHKSDGTLQHFGPGFWQTGQTGQGQSGNTGTGKNGETGQQTPQQQQQQVSGKQNFQYNPDGSVVFNVPDQNAQGQGTPQNPTYTSTVQKDINHNSTQGSINHTANQNIVHNAQQNITNTAGQSYSRSAGTSINDSAPAIGHNGPTSVTGTLGVSQTITGLAYNQSSDRRAKDNFAPIEGAFGTAMTLKPLWFDLYESDFSDGSLVRRGDPIRTFGLVAQDVRHVIPELVVGDEETEVLKLSESKIGVLVLAAFQEFAHNTTKQISALEARIDELERKTWPTLITGGATI